MADTSLSLLDRLRTTPHHETWERFVHLYTPLLMQWARRAGVPQNDIGDLIQDVFILLLKKLPEFTYEPQRGRFRGWLRTVLVNRWREQCRRRMLTFDEESRLAEWPSPASESFWEGEYREHLVGRALTILKADFRPVTWQAFWRVVVDASPPSDVAVELGLTVGAVHAARFRVLSRLRHELSGLLD
jgi:RNA polymerase sigma-70 factor (ECF subfamily)